ncbi:MAG: T9SS type A sorting domain-containing protein [Bacteroidia bacterium]
MKKSLQLFLGITTLASASLLAQPTLTATGCNFAIGDVYTSKTASYVSPGSAGANQTWNLSAMTGTATTTYTGVAVSSTPYASTFSSASISMKSSTAGTYGYYNTSSSAMSVKGLVTPSGTTTVVFNYSNPEDYLHYPFNYNNSYVDAFQATFTSAGYNYVRRGVDSVQYDGYGTLTTPTGTYNNVVRVHMIENYQDSTNFPGIGAYIITYRDDLYMWYLNGNHYPIASVFTLTSSLSSPTTGGSYLTTVAVGVEEENAVISSCRLFPNPASNNINVSVNLSESQKVEIKLFNTLGAQVNSTVSAEGIVGANDFKIDVSALPEGVYFAQIHLDGNLNTTRRFVVSK